MPVVIKPVEVTRYYALCFHFCYKSPCQFFCRQEPAKESATITGRIRHLAEGYLGNSRKSFLQSRMVLLLNGKELIYPFYLCQSHRCMQLRDAEVIPKERMQVGTSVNSFMVVTMIRECITLHINIFSIGQDHTALSAGHGLYKVEGEGAGITNSTKAFSFIGGPNALAGIFQQKKVMFFTDGLQCIHIGHAAT